MTKNTEAVLEQALRLGPVERVELIDALYRSFDRKSQGPYDAKWAEEAEDRLRAYRAGEITADSAEAVFRRIEKA